MWCWRIRTSAAFRRLRQRRILAIIIQKARPRPPNAASSSKNAAKAHKKIRNPVIDTTNYKKFIAKHQAVSSVALRKEARESFPTKPPHEIYSEMGLAVITKYTLSLPKRRIARTAHSRSLST